MNKLVRGLVAGVATTAIVATGVAVSTQQAAAAPLTGDPNACIDGLSRASARVRHPQVTTWGLLPATTGATSKAACEGLYVSIGISRTNGRDFRNQNASSYPWEQNTYYFCTPFELDRYDVGDWMIRQIAVRKPGAFTVVKYFTPTSTPQLVRVKYTSVLTGSPTGSLRPSSTGYVKIQGTLKTWHVSGKLVNLQNQPVIVQVKRPGNYAYKTIATATTSRYGTYGKAVKLSNYRGYSVRVGFAANLNVIAQDFTFLGTVR